MRIKLKTKNSIKKRFKKTSKGYLKHDHAYTSHHFSNKTTKQKRHLRKSSLLKKADFKRYRKMSLNGL